MILCGSITLISLITDNNFDQEVKDYVNLGNHLAILILNYLMNAINILTKINILFEKINFMNYFNNY